MEKTVSLPPRPPLWEERLANRVVQYIAPRLRSIEPPDPPETLRPWEHVQLGHVGATWYPVPREARGTVSEAAALETSRGLRRGRGVVSEAAALETSRGLRRGRGVVLFSPPWLEWGQSYFHRRGRIEAVREAGYHALSFDLSGFGRSSSTREFRDRDVAIALAEAKRRADGLPVHVWGVSSGGYWLHPILAQESGVTSAFFEDVSPHLMEWSAHTQPRFARLYSAIRWPFPRVDRFMNMRNHAPLRVKRCAYVIGSDDPGIPVEEARELARLAGGELHVFEGAGHLQAIKRERERVIRLALETFA